MVFTESEIEQFLTDGYVILRGAFSRETAAQGREFVWNQVPLWEQSTTNGMPMIHIKRGFTCAPFDCIVTSDRLRAALDQMVGAGRWKGPTGCGWWPLLLPGFPGTSGWHVDSGWEDGRLAIREGHASNHCHALTTLLLFSDMGPGDGGTPMIRGSHLKVARAVIDAGEPGIAWPELFEREVKSMESDVAYVTGEAGDVALMHNYLVHGFGPNRGNRIRFACNPLVQLTEPLRLTRQDGAHSPVEIAIRRATGVTP